MQLDVFGSPRALKVWVLYKQMLAFALALFPPTGILGAGQFVHDKGPRSWLGWTQLVTLLGQILVLYFLRQTILYHTELVSADDVLCEPDTQILLITSLVLLFLGIGLYMYGIWRTVPQSI